MRCRTLRPASFYSPHRTCIYQPEEESLGRRCLDSLRKDVLPTLLILAVGGMLTLYLSDLIDRARQGVTELKSAQVSQLPGNQDLDAISFGKR